MPAWSCERGRPHRHRRHGEHHGSGAGGRRTAWPAVALGPARRAAATSPAGALERRGRAGGCRGRIRRARVAGLRTADPAVRAVGFRDGLVRDVPDPLLADRPGRARPRDRPRPCGHGRRHRRLPARHAPAADDHVGGRWRGACATSAGPCSPTTSPTRRSPRRCPRAGCSTPLVGTLQQVGIAVLISVPLSIVTAVYLNEVRGRFRRYVRILVDAMSGLPSIVAGLFIYATVVLALGWGFSGFAASLALSMLMLPLITRTTEEVLRIVPGRPAGGRACPRRARVARDPARRAPDRPGRHRHRRDPRRRPGGRARRRRCCSRRPANSVLNTNPFDGPQSNLPLYVYQQVAQPGRQRPRPGVDRRVRADHAGRSSCSRSPASSAGLGPGRQRSDRLRRAFRAIFRRRAPEPPRSADT